MPFNHQVAYLPEPRPDVVTDDWLAWLKDLGYTGIYLEPDPAGPRRSGNSSQFRTLYRLISLYDLAWGHERRRLRDWIAHCCDRCHAHGLKTYLALWEPRLPVEAWGLIPNEWHGRGGFDREPWNVTGWCLSQPDAAAAFREMATEAFRAVPDVDGLKIGAHDNDAHLCNPEQCERCAGKTKPRMLRRLFELLVDAIGEGGLDRAGFEYVLYTWWWPEEAVDGVAELLPDRDVTVLGRSTQGTTQYWRGEKLGEVKDLALGVDGIGPRFRREIESAKRRGWKMADMTGFGHTIEYFWLPYTPAPDRVAKRMAALRDLGSSGWFDFDCGGVYPGINTEIIREQFEDHDAAPEAWIDRALDRLYKPDEQDAARAAYDAADAALRSRPVAFDAEDVRSLSGRMVIECVPMLPFDPDDFRGHDHGHRIAWSGPANFVTPVAAAKLLEMFTACLSHWERAEAAFEPLTGRGAWAESILPWEKRVVLAHRLCTASVMRYLKMGANRLARAAGELDARAERDRLVPLLEAEQADAQRFAEMWRADRRLLMNVNIRIHEFIQMCRPWLEINLDDPFETKLAHLQTMLDRCRDDTWVDAMPVLRGADA